MSWKFVILEVRSEAGAIEVPVIFPAILTHSVVAEAIKCTCLRAGRRHTSAVSAGMIDGLTVHNLHGRSETLDIGVRADDVDVIETYHYTHGIKA